MASHYLPGSTTFLAVVENSDGHVAAWSPPAPVPEHAAGRAAGWVFILDKGGRHVVEERRPPGGDPDTALRRAGWSRTQSWHVDDVGRWCAAVEPVIPVVAPPR